MTHALKTVQPYYDLVVSGDKTFEVRKNDRPFRVGDVLLLQEYEPIIGYTGKEISFVISYILDNPNYVKKGFVVLGMIEGQTNH